MGELFKNHNFIPYSTQQLIKGMGVSLSLSPSPPHPSPETRTVHTEVLNVGISPIINKEQGFKMSNYICQNTFYFISFLFLGFFW